MRYAIFALESQHNWIASFRTKEQAICFWSTLSIKSWVVDRLTSLRLT
jgi:hypothetical protein